MPNASIGASTDLADIRAEAAQAAGADTLMELSVGGDLDGIRRENPLYAHFDRVV